MKRTKPVIYSIVIPVVGEYAMTMKCLKSVKRYSKDYEITLVDNGSPLDIQQKYLNLGGRIKVLTFDNSIGYAKACNAGAEWSRGKYLIFLNNDTEVCKNWLEILSRHTCEYLMSGYARLGITGTAGEKLIFTVDGIKTNPTQFISCYDSPSGPATKDLPKQTHYAGGGCLMIPREIWDKVGKFDENMGLCYCEDADYGLRCTRAGYGCVVAPVYGYKHKTFVTTKLVAGNIGQRIVDNMAYLSFKQRLRPLGVEEVTCMVLSWNTLEDTKLCVDSILRERELLKICGVTLHVVVIDNGSTDGTWEYLKEISFELDDIKVVLNRKNTGISHGRNQGIDRRRGKYLFMVDSDISIVKGSFVAMIKYLEARPEIANIGPHSWQCTPDWDFQTNFLEGICSVTENWETYAGVKGMFCAMTQYGIFRSNIFEGKNPIRFDEGGLLGKSGWGYEDNDLALQMRARGYRILRFDEITYYHHINSSRRNFEAQKISDMHKERREYVMKKWGLMPGEIPVVPDKKKIKTKWKIKVVYREQKKKSKRRKKR